jgi:hypothetical protein
LIVSNFRSNASNFNQKRLPKMKSIVSSHCKIVVSDWEMPLLFDNVSHIVVFYDATDFKTIRKDRSRNMKSYFDSFQDFFKKLPHRCQNIKVVLHHFKNVNQLNEQEKQVVSMFSRYDPIIIQDLYSKKNVSEVLSKARIPDPKTPSSSSSSNSSSSFFSKISFSKKKKSEKTSSPKTKKKEENDDLFDFYSFCDSPKKTLDSSVIEILSKTDENGMKEINKQLENKFQKSKQEIKAPINSFVIQMEKKENQKWTGKVMLNNYNSFDLNCQVYCSNQMDIDKTKFTIKKEFSIELNISYFGEVIEGSFVVLKFSKMFKKTAYLFKLKFK